jgi:hypothetical protein
MVTPPILDNKNSSSPSISMPSASLREARRKKHLPTVQVPSVCLLDPDGDLVRTLRATGRTKPFAGWPCYHTELDTFSLAGQEVGIIGRVVGASFAVLVAEELFASGCRLHVSLTSSGQVVASGPPPYFVIVDRALRDEGDELPLRSSCRIRRGRPMACRKRRKGHFQKEPASGRRRHLDDGRAVSRDGRSDRGSPKEGNSCSRDGGSGDGRSMAPVAAISCGDCTWNDRPFCCAATVRSPRRSTPTCRSAI